MNTYTIKCDHQGDGCCVESEPTVGLAAARDAAFFAGWFIGKRKRNEPTYCPACFAALGLRWTGSMLVRKED